MSEEKVWVEELPESCFGCFCENGRFCNISISYIMDNYNNGNRPKNCPLHSIKGYKKELVNEVCEKIYKRMESLSHKCIEFRKKDDYLYAWFNLEMFKEILDQIQKEFDNGGAK